VIVVNSCDNNEKLAHLAVLSDDPLTLDATSLRDISAAMTMVGGRIAYETANWLDRR
jgi:predicted amidohydrolase YtcJ